VPTIQETLRAAVARLGAAHVDAPATTARLLLAKALGKSKEWLIAHSAEPLDAAIQRDFQDLLERVIAHEPLAYVLGHREFYGLDLIVDRRVLIPRPETELLADLALHELKSEALKRETAAQFSLLDVGTGSGAIPIAVAKHAPNAKLLATDVSADALAVARLNAGRHGVADRIAFVQADLLDGIATLPPVITANLPYVTRAEIEGLPPEIQAHEPRVALDGGEDGLVLVRRLLQQIADRLKTCQATSLRAAYLEIGAAQDAAALTDARRILPNAHSEIKRDLAGLDRVLAIHFSRTVNDGNCLPYRSIA